MIIIFEEIEIDKHTGHPIAFFIKFFLIEY